MGCGARTAFGVPCPPLSPVENCFSRFLLGFAPAFLAHRFAIEFDAVGVMNQPVENAVGERRVADLLCQWASGNCEVRIIDRR